MTPVLLRFWRDDRGATAIEYCLIGGIVSIVIFAAMASIGSKLSQHYFQPIANSLS